ncbi:MAG: hypothetical protein NNA25_05635 [Nitrospira sp.]|nr:hypothetical protein [Nitrospira sp.]
MRSGAEGDGDRWGNGAKRRGVRRGESQRESQGELRVGGVGLVHGLLLAGSLLLGPGAGQAAEFIPLGVLPGGPLALPMASRPMGRSWWGTASPPARGVKPFAGQQELA